MLSRLIYTGLTLLSVSGSPYIPALVVRFSRSQGLDSIELLWMKVLLSTFAVAEGICKSSFIENF